MLVMAKPRGIGQRGPACVARRRISSTRVSASAHASDSRYVHTARQLYEEVWTNNNVKLLDEIMHADHVQNDACWNSVTGLVHGRDKFARGVRGFRVGYPDLVFKVETAVQLPDTAESLEAKQVRVMVEWMASGSNQRAVLGSKATKQRMQIKGLAILHFDAEGGVIVRSDVFRQATPEELAPFVPVLEDIQAKLKKGGAKTAQAQGSNSKFKSEPETQGEPGDPPPSGPWVDGFRIH